MSATMPYYYISPYTACHCTWTVCQCFTHIQNYTSYTTQWIGGYYEPEPLPKAVANKARMDALRFRADIRPRPRIRLASPSIRPSVQALSIRIR